MKASAATRRRGRVLSCRIAVLVMLGMAVAGCGSDNNPIIVPPPTTKQACADCHVRIADQEAKAKHQATQEDVAEELAGERAGLTPEEVLHGDDPENCIACHGPTSILTRTGMTESEALGYFFTTTQGRFTDNTTAAHTDQWPHVACQVCHDAPDDHPSTAPALAIFDSQTGLYTPMADSSPLCGQCHGSLAFAETDHLTYDAWAPSGHGDDQLDVADELAAERAGETPHEVVTGDDPENCIACHAPTAVLKNGGMVEADALDYFFTTTGGVFTSGTTIQHAAEWPDVGCIACHDPHDPDTPAYFNSSTRLHESVASADELCGRCHGSLRFASTDHLSYDIRLGTGGIGVPDSMFMPSVSCVDCHMFAGDVDGSNSSMFHGHSFAITVPEDGGNTVSCTHCHASMDAEATIAQFQADFEALDATAAANVEAAAAALAGSSDPILLAKLEQAQHDLAYAESDESGGFHNHTYLMALLNDANDRALEILAAP